METFASRDPRKRRAGVPVHSSSRGGSGNNAAGTTVRAFNVVNRNQRDHRAAARATGGRRRGNRRHAHGPHAASSSRQTNGRSRRLKQEHPGQRLPPQQQQRSFLPESAPSAAATAATAATAGAAVAAAAAAADSGDASSRGDPCDLDAGGKHGGRRALLDEDVWARGPRPPSPPLPKGDDESRQQHAGPRRCLSLALPPSAIPEEFHLTLTSRNTPVGAASLLPAGSPAPHHPEHYRVAHDPVADVWRTTVFPPLVPSGRGDVLVLDRWLRLMVERHLGSTGGNAGAGEAWRSGAAGTPPDAGRDPAGWLSALVNIYAMAMGEIARQVSVECAERGQLLARVWHAILDLHTAQLTQARQEEERLRAALAEGVAAVRRENREAVVALAAQVKRHVDRAAAATASASGECGRLSHLLAEADGHVQAHTRGTRFAEGEVLRLQGQLAAANARVEELATTVRRLEDDGGQMQQRTESLERALKAYDGPLSPPCLQCCCFTRYLYIFFILFFITVVLWDFANAAACLPLHPAVPPGFSAFAVRATRFLDKVRATINQPEVGKAPNAGQANDPISLNSATEHPSWANVMERLRAVPALAGSGAQATRGHSGTGMRSSKLGLEDLGVDERFEALFQNVSELMMMARQKKDTSTASK